MKTFIAFTFIWLSCSIMAQSLSVKTNQKQLEKEKGTLIDVRTREEFHAERISGAINIDVNGPAFPYEISDLDKNKAYFLYCGMGKRSAKALKLMKENGFEKVYALEKGLEEWKAQGQPVEKINSLSCSL